MMMRAFAIFLVASLLVVIPSRSDAELLQIDSLALISLKEGPNFIKNFTPDRANGMIVVGTRANGNAHGYSLYLTMTERDDQHGWDVVDIVSGKGGSETRDDTIRDDPLTGEDVAKSVRFAHGSIDGKKSVLMIVATRDLSTAKTLYDLVPVSIEIFKLEQVEQPEIGYTPYAFQSIERHKTTETYQNANCALLAEFKLADFNVDHECGDGNHTDP